MRKNDSLKRLLILCLSFLGVVISTGMYAYTWIFQYHQRYVYNVKLYFWGHIMMVLIYFILLLCLVYTTRVAIQIDIIA